MKTQYAVMNKQGRILCYQHADSEDQAIEFARMYGHRGAKAAIAVINL